MSKSMSAAVLQGIKDWRVDERPIPEPEPGKVLVASGRVNLQPVISRVLPLKQATEALALAGAKIGVVKVQIDLT
jgi:threonine dehydrogenase-like Zn-dependent dehydrogenase